MREIKFRAWDRKYKRWTPMITGMNEGDSVILNIPENEHLAICQFTGLHDKNGKEIYEGDIIAHPNIRNRVVDMHIGCNYKMDMCEVIGNLYENPELAPQGQT